MSIESIDVDRGASSLTHRTKRQFSKASNFNKCLWNGHRRRTIDSIRALIHQQATRWQARYFIDKRFGRNTIDEQ